MPDDVSAEGVESKVILRGQAISSPDRVVFSDVGLTKADVARYYDAVADRMLPFLRNRPLSLVRHPDGVDKPGFFQKHAGPGFPSTIREAEVLGDTVMLINRADGILAAVQMGAIEFHIRGTRADSPEKPDRMVFDLDPDPAVGFAEVREAAAEIRDRLATLGLPSWPMVTGGKGVHVVVPLARVASTETVELFAKLFATRLAQQVPDRFTSMLAKKKRVGRIFVDWLRNQQQATAVCPWSLRARPGAPVAVPVEWDELAALERANVFGVEAAIGHSPITEPRPGAITAAVIRRFESAG